MLEKTPSACPQGLRAAINNVYRTEEKALVQQLLKEAFLTETHVSSIQKRATRLVERVRQERRQSTGIDSFLTEYTLSSEEGIALMCLAEALLRVPDKETIDKLIRDKLAPVDWKSHQGQSDMFFVNAATWALMLTGKVLNADKHENRLTKALLKFANRAGEGIVRKAVEKAMHIMSKQFVMGRTIQEAIGRAQKLEAQGYRYSYDMLGEAALTAKDAQKYLLAYQQAIENIGKAFTNTPLSLYEKAGISIKLSALYPRYQEAQHEQVMENLAPKLLGLAQLAKKYDISMTIDAEESERLDLSLDLIEKVFTDESLNGWNGFGLALQSYQKRAFYVLDWLAELARKTGRRMMVRLIKGAYWDSEIKKAQMQGLSEYPVFTRKAYTDVSFQACAKKMMTMTDAIYPQFATHNAYSVAMILEIVGEYRDFEFQCLHGMGTNLYEQIVPKEALNIPCRIYAPVGTHEDLLPYLVRRLLENGANSSFVNRIVDEKAPVSSLVEDPVLKSSVMLERAEVNIPLPANIMPGRKNSQGLDLSDRQVKADLYTQLKEHSPLYQDAAKPLIAAAIQENQAESVISPQAVNQTIGTVQSASAQDIEAALQAAEKTFITWSNTSVDVRAQAIENFADSLEKNRTELYALLCLEAGKTWVDAIGEVREAVDFCRYYAQLAREQMGEGLKLQGYTGETNTLSLHPRGTILCISPWNFPLAIFTGQIVAALVTGNCVIAKPAEQTPLIAFKAMNLLHAAGVPIGAAQLLPGTGEAVGAPLVKDQRIQGVIFTGSTETARLINQTLAAREGAIIPLIAETGGQNAMIVDSSALLEQVVIDAVQSSFGSAGQRCSALRVLFVQEEVYLRTIELLKGSMEELIIGDPAFLDTDIGPVIDEQALSILQTHVQNMREAGYPVFACDLPKACGNGHFIAPTVIEIPDISVLKREVFGPILHVVKFNKANLDAVIAAINNTQYGLTLGIHSRIGETVDYIRERVRAGNCYVNRNMVGAVVGLQPFGGEGLSGTGPKAGGPHYLSRLCHERTVTVDTTAAGGNAMLMALPEEGM